MRLSFVVPAYNEEAYLPDCLDAITTQVRALPPALQSQIEIIVVNNASSDRTGQVARQYPGVTVVDEPQKGLTHARQAGFSACTGELIANVDADSRLTPGWLNRVLAEFDRQPKLVAFSGPLVYYDIAPKDKWGVTVFYGIAYLVYLINRYVLRAGSMVQGGNFVLSARALREIGGFNTAIAFYGEDTDIARRLNRIGKVEFNLGLKMFSSARRLNKEGAMTMAWRYTVNYFWTTFRKRPFTEDYLDIREQPEG